MIHLFHVFAFNIGNAFEKGNSPREIDKYQTFKFIR